MAPKMKKPPPPPPQQQEKEASLEEEEEGEEEEDSSEAIPEGNAPADEVAASLRPKKSKLSGEVAASPKPKKTRVAPSPAPKRAKKAAPSQEEDGSEERPQEESGEASAEMDPSAIETTAASSPRKPSGEIVAPPQHNKKRAAASPVSKRAKKPTPPLEEEQRSDEEVEAELEAEEESGHTRPVTNARADKTATQRKRSKPSGANAASPERKKRGKPSAKLPPRSKRDKAASNDEEVEQAEEDGADNSGEALLERNASSAKLPGSKREKKPAVERSWSMEDELRILTTLAEHAQTHGGAQLEASDLFATLAASFDRRDADTSKLANKVRKLRGRHERVRSQGCPADGHGRQLFELCEIVWGSDTLQNRIQGAAMAPRRSLRNTSSSGHVVPGEAHQEGGGGGEHLDAPTGTLVVDVGACKDNSVPFVKDGDANSGKFEDNGGQVDEDEQVKATFVRREFSELSILYPDLAKEVKGYAASYNSGELIMSAFETIGDDEARDLDARCKKQRIDMFNLEMSQAELTKVLLCTLAGLIN